MIRDKYPLLSFSQHVISTVSRVDAINYTINKMLSSTIGAMCPPVATLQTCSRPSANAPAFALPKELRRRAGGQTTLRMVKLSAAFNDLGEEDLEAQLEEFMQRQAELESGDSKRKAEPGQVLGAAEVSEDEAKKYCREIVNVLKLLKNKRDMSVNEVKLTIAIEDPRSRERRLMGMEDSSGVSRDEMADALDAVAEGKIPTDRIALRELHREMVNWPFVDADEPGTTGR